MKLLFVHTAEKVKKDSKGNYYTDGTYDANVWKRYIGISDEVTFLARFDANTYTDEYIIEKFNIIPKGKINVETISNTYTSLKQYFNFKTRKDTRKKVKKLVSEADKIIIRLPCDEGYLAAKYAKEMNKDYLIECVGCVWDALWNYNYKGKLLATQKFIKMRKTIKFANYVLYVTKKFLQKRYPTKGRSINCSDVVLQDNEEEILNKKVNAIESKNGKIILGTLGAIDVPYKGQSYVIEAISKLVNLGYDIEYQLVGNGSINLLNRTVEKCNMKKNVKFLGAYPHDKVFDWLDNIDIYIQPSKLEGLPRALVETMSRGNICLGSDVGGIPELLDKEFLFKKCNVNQIRDKIEQTIKNYTKLKEQAILNYNKSKEYNTEILNERRTKFLNDFIKEE